MKSYHHYYLLIIVQTANSIVHLLKIRFILLPFKYIKTNENAEYYRQTEVHPINEILKKTY
jgi:hypothetical protein